MFQSVKELHHQEQLKSGLETTSLTCMVFGAKSLLDYVT